MKLRKRLTLYYSITFSLVTGVTLLVVYLFSADYREDEFYTRLKDRTLTTYRLLMDVEQIDHDLLKVLDKNTINSLYEEKIMIFDSTGKIIYSSIDDTKIFYAADIIEELKKDYTDELKKNEGKYELLGINFTEDGTSFYGIAKAYDRFGKSKLNFLGWVLVFVFITVVLLVLIISFYLSKAITVPVSQLSKEIQTISPQNLAIRVEEPATKDEINFLAQKFNEMLARVEQAFRFQNHFTHHISHELKTPLAVLVSNIERIQQEDDVEKWREGLAFQKEGLMEISNIINALLDISKIETGSENISKERLRIDEMLFECMAETNTLYDNSRFDVSISPDITDSAQLEVEGSGRMLKIALTNLLKNAVLYAQTYPVTVSVYPQNTSVITEIINDGTLIKGDEIAFLFTHFFRGSNTGSTRGFGLGLVLVSKIVGIHGGSIVYTEKQGKNVFTLTLPVAS